MDCNIGEKVNEMLKNSINKIVEETKKGTMRHRKIRTGEITTSKGEYPIATNGVQFEIFLNDQNSTLLHIN